MAGLDSLTIPAINPIKLHSRTFSLGNSLKSPLTRTGSIAASPKVVQALASQTSDHRRALSLDNIDLSFRLYKYDSGQLSLVPLAEDKVERSLAEEGALWDAVLNPAVEAPVRDAQLATLLDLPLEGHTMDPGTPKSLQKHYSVCMMAAVPEDHAVGGDTVNSKLSRFATKAQGPPNTKEYRLFVEEDGKPISSWHDIPLRNEDGTLNFVCEIPANTSAKMEVATGERLTPIKQDIKKGNLRFYPYNINWNYGMLPQTWEDPDHANEELGGIKGDNDPVDVVEIGSAQLQTGGVYRVKALGAYAMVDDGELDWKILCIRVDDPLAPVLNDIEDIEREMPGELERIMVWFRDYKMPDGKPANSFGYDSRPLNREAAHAVINDTHSLYKDLKEGVRPNTGGLALASH